MRIHRYSSIAAIGITVACLSTSGSQAQTSETARCPQGHWLIERVCIDRETGDVVMASPAASAGEVSEPGCAPGYWRLDRVCVSRATGDVELADESRLAHQRAEAKD